MKNHEIKLVIKGWRDWDEVKTKTESVKNRLKSKKNIELLFSCASYHRKDHITIFQTSFLLGIIMAAYVFSTAKLASRASKIIPFLTTAYIRQDRLMKHAAHELYPGLKTSAANRALHLNDLILSFKLLAACYFVIAILFLIEFCAAKFGIDQMMITFFRLSKATVINIRWMYLHCDW